MYRLTLQIHDQGQCHDALALALPDILSELGLSNRVMDHPAIALGKLERRMAEWGLA